MEILKIYIVEQFLIKYCVIEHLILQKKNLKYDRYQYGLASMAYKLFDKKDSDGNTAGGTAKSKIMPNQKLAKKLCKTIMRKFK